MPTPPMNTDFVRQVPEIWTTQALSPTVGPVVPHVLGNGNVAWVKDIKPASGNSDRVKGFRLCRAWDHRISNISYAGTTSSYEYSSGSVKTLYRYLSGSWWQGARTPPTPIAPSSNMINAALVKALAKLKDQDVHLGNFLAEGGKTIDMVGHAASLIGRQVLNWRRNNPQALWDLVRKYERGGTKREDWCLIPKSWLELQYGWKPLMSDVQGALAHISRRDRFDIPYVSVKGHQGDVVQNTTVMNGVIGLSQQTTRWNHERDVWVNLVYGLSTPWLAELSSLGLINPAEMVWETLPYSFVVDWFLPIGGWLAALTSNLGYQFITGSQSRKTTVVQSGVSVKPPSNTVTEKFSVNPSYFTGKDVLFQRVCYTTSPVPGLYVKSPLSLAHATNGIALLASAFR